MSICGNVTSSVTRAVTGSVTGSNEGGCSGSKGVVFSGSEAIYAPNTVLTDPGVDGMTMVAWVFADFSSNAAVMSVSENAAGEQFHGILTLNNLVYAYSRQTSYVSAAVSVPGVIIPGNLIHVAAVFASNSSRIVYADGVAGTEDTASQAVPGINTFSIGAQAKVGGALNRQYSGAIYHAAWYNRALSPTEIAELAAGANPRNYSGLVRYLPLAGAATAADELIEPSTWTTVGTLEDGDCATTVTEAYVPTAIDVKIGVSQHSLNASKGAAFSGTQAISAPNTILTEPGVDGMTMACWATVPASGSVQTLMAIDSTSTSDEIKIAIFDFGNAGTTVALRSHSNAAQHQRTLAAAEGDLLHFAGVFSGDSLRISYINGATSGSNTTTVSVASIDGFRIGVGDGVTIYHAAWYNRALSPTEIAELAAGADPQDYAGLVRYLPLNGAANAASEVIEPSTWTVAGTLADGAGDTTVTKQTFTNANLGGKTPKGALAFMTNATVADTVTANAHLSLGATDGVNEWAYATNEEDNVPAATVGHSNADNKFIIARDSSSRELEAEIDAFSADSTAVNFTDASPAAYLASMVQFAGTDVKAEAGKLAVATTIDTAVTATLSDTTLDADVIIFGYDRNTTPFDSTFSSWVSIGFAVKDGGSVGNYSVIREAQGVSPSSLAAVVRNNRCGGALQSGVTRKNFEVTGISAGSFDLTTRDSTVANARDISYLALSFGGAKVKAGTIETPTNAGVDWNVTGVGFKPQFVFSAWTLILGAYNTVKTDKQATSLALYAFTADTAATTCITSDDDVSTTRTDSRTGAEFALRQNYTNSNIVQFENPQFNSDGWTVAAADISLAEANARQGIYVAVEDVSE